MQKQIVVDDTAEKAQKSALQRWAFTVDEVSTMLGISYVSTLRLLKRGLLRSAPGLRTRVIPRSEIERFLSGVKA